jgi:hypothetical protein
MLRIYTKGFIGSRSIEECINPCEIYQLEADGEELVNIRKKFYNIPMTSGSFVIWTDECARFIYLNYQS